MTVLPLALLGQNTPRIAPVPADPLELATGPIRVLSTSPDRDAALQLLIRARSNYMLQGGGQAYDLRVGFTANSLGRTNYDGSWEMEDQFVPGQGQRWTAKSAAGYMITGISTNGKLYGEGTSSAVPLRLQEARGMLLDPLPGRAHATSGSIRTATAAFHGTTVTCVLLSSSRNTTFPSLGRGWEESEECIDPQSGLLMMHSQAPGNYAAYDYTNAPQFAGRTLPRSVTVTEAGSPVLKVNVESLEPLSSTDPSLLVPTAAMSASGPATVMATTTKLTRIHGQFPAGSAGMIRPVVVFGMLTPTGQLVEVHSLQPGDPNSDAAVQDARSIDFSPALRPGSRPQQHFVFVIEKFVGQQ
ncbi:MAG TPA: hypothetical protein VGL72_18130 [Bryobacteraceae bacterium]|jgi:hypothetical protein